MRLSFIFLFYLLGITLMGQESTLISFDEYITLVKENHPVMYQSKLLADRANVTKRIAKGAFDPKMEGSWNQKSFDDKNYYSYASGAIKVPTWYGIDLKAGYERNSGQFLNDSDFIPSRGLWNAGISIPLGKGLIIDNRRAELKKADIYKSVTEQEQILMINQVLYQASLAYLEWQSATAFLNIADEGIALANNRLEGTRSSFINGDKPAIDTLESFISLQNRQIEYQKAEQLVRTTRNELNNFLWLDGDIPLETDYDSQPEDISINQLQTSLDSLILTQDQWIANHPELLLYDYKIADIQVDQRLAKEDLKPEVRINYNPLIGVADDALFDQFSPNNYKLGATFSYSIFQRKERGKIQLNEIKSNDVSYQRSIKNQELITKLTSYKINIQQTQIQNRQIEETISNYNKMLNAENRKFSIGESSIFLVNSRESKYLQSRYKRIEVSRKLIFNRLTYLMMTSRMSEFI